MAFSSSNQQERKEVNTSGLLFKNGNGIQPCALTMSHWGGMLRLAFAKELDKSQQTQERRYDYKNPDVTCVSPEKCQALLLKYESEIKPAMLENKQASITITIASVNSIGISTGVEHSTDGKCRPMLILCKNINDQTLIPEEITTYEFNKTEIITNYNPTTGQFEYMDVVDSEFHMFITLLKDIVSANNNAYVHADRVVNKYSKDIMDNKLNEIGAALGKDLAFKPNSYSGSNYSNGDVFNRSNNNSTSNLEPTIISSLEDMDINQ